MSTEGRPSVLSSEKKWSAIKVGGIYPIVPKGDGDEFSSSWIVWVTCLLKLCAISRLEQCSFSVLLLYNWHTKGQFSLLVGL